MDNDTYEKRKEVLGSIIDGINEKWFGAHGLCSKLCVDWECNCEARKSEGLCDLCVKVSELYMLAWEEFNKLESK